MAIEQISSIESVGSVPIAILAVAWLLLAGWGAGRILRLVFREKQVFDGYHEIVFLVAGLHVVGWMGVCLGMTGALSGSNSVTLLGAFSSAGIVEAWWSRLPSRLVSNCRLLLAVSPNWSWLGVVVFALLTLGPALNYPTGWDELVYHSVLPRRWMADGWPAFYVDIPYSGFPSLVEILCWQVAPLESIVVPRLFVWVCWMLSLVLAYSVFQRRSDRTAGWLLTMALACSPISLMISANCYVEVFQLLDLLAILFVHDDWTEKESSRPIVNSILIGVLAGGCGAVKLTGGIILIVPLIWLLKNAIIDQRCIVRVLIYLGTILLMSFVFAMPFYGRAWIFSGNPFYPYFAGWFSNDVSLLETSLYHHSIATDSFGMRGFVAYLITPVFLAWDDALYDGRFGWQWIVIVGLSALGLKHSVSKKIVSEPLWLWSVAIVLYSFWFFSSQQARFALPLFVTLAMLACSCLREMKRRNRTVSGSLLVIATILCVPWTNAGYYLASWERLLGIWNNTQYIDDTLEVEDVPLVAAIEKHTSADAKLLFLFEQRSLYAPRECVIGTPFFQAEGLTPPEQYSEVAPLLGYLDQEKISHVVFATKPLGPDRSSQWWNRSDSLCASFEKAIQLGHLQVLWKTDNYLLLRVMAKPVTQ